MGVVSLVGKNGVKKSSSHTGLLPHCFLNAAWRTSGGKNRISIRYDGEKAKNLYTKETFTSQVMNVKIYKQLEIQSLTQLGP